MQLGPGIYGSRSQTCYIRMEIRGSHLRERVCDRLPLVVEQVCNLVLFLSLLLPLSYISNASKTISLSGLADDHLQSSGLMTYCLRTGFSWM